MCKHENADHLMAGDRIRIKGSWVGYRKARCEQLRCIDCGAWLSLGKAGKADRTEVAAARLVSSWYRQYNVRSCESHTVSWLDHLELLGRSPHAARELYRLARGA